MVCQEFEQEISCGPKQYIQLKKIISIYKYTHQKCIQPPSVFQQAINGCNPITSCTDAVQVHSAPTTTAFPLLLLTGCVSINLQEKCWHFHLFFSSFLISVSFEIMGPKKREEQLEYVFFMCKKHNDVLTSNSQSPVSFLIFIMQ